MTAKFSLRSPLQTRQTLSNSGATFTMSWSVLEKSPLETRSLLTPYLDHERPDILKSIYLARYVRNTSVIPDGADPQALPCWRKQRRIPEAHKSQHGWRRSQSNSPSCRKSAYTTYIDDIDWPEVPEPNLHPKGFGSPDYFITFYIITWVESRISEIFKRFS